MLGGKYLGNDFIEPRGDDVHWTLALVPKSASYLRVFTVERWCIVQRRIERDTRVFIRNAADIVQEGEAGHNCGARMSHRHGLRSGEPKRASDVAV